jgi:hypothetical protein
MISSPYVPVGASKAVVLSSSHEQNLVRITDYGVVSNVPDDHPTVRQCHLELWREVFRRAETPDSATTGVLDQTDRQVK